MSESYLQWSTDKILPGEPLPAPLFLLLEGRYVRYRSKGQIIDRLTFDRLEHKHVQELYIASADVAVFETWVQNAHQIKATKETKNLRITREESRRHVADIFHSFHKDEAITQALETSMNLVEEITKQPFATQALSELQTLSRGTADHSVNVSVLSVYLALNMGYSHMIILKHLGAGALLHDIGKIDALKIEEGHQKEYDEKIRQHPLIGEAMLAGSDTITREMRLIIAQHHECHDGSGYPKKLHGDQIYDLAKIVSIANTFDGLVSGAIGSLAERQQYALAQLKGPLAPKFQPMKLQKAIKILGLGI